MVLHGCKGYMRFHGYLWFHKASRVSRGYMVSCVNTWLLGLHEVLWFHGFTGYSRFNDCKGLTRLHGFMWFHNASRVSRGYMVSCGFTWLYGFTGYMRLHGF